MTEFTSADGLSRMRETKRKRYLTYYDDEHPISAQLFGSNPETLADSARICQDAGFDLVDLNLGCPAKRVVACNGGSGLLRDLPRIETIFEARPRRRHHPLHRQVPHGLERHEHRLRRARAAWPKTAASTPSPSTPAPASRATPARRAGSTSPPSRTPSRIPVIGNGDIRTPEDAAAMVDATDCDAVMIGRAAPANPWIFRQIAQYTATQASHRHRHLRQAHRHGPLPHDPRLLRDAHRTRSPKSTAEVLGPAEADHRRSASERNHESAQRDAIGKMKQFASWFTHGVPGGATLRKAIFEAKTGHAVLDSVEAFFATRQRAARSLEREPEAELDAVPVAWG